MGGCRQLSWGRWICHKRATDFKNFYIYDAKHALLLHTHGPLLEHNQARELMARGSLEDSFVLFLFGFFWGGGQDFGYGRTRTVGKDGWHVGGRGHIWTMENSNSRRSVSVCVSPTLILLSPDPNSPPRRHEQTVSIWWSRQAHMASV